MGFWLLPSNMGAKTCQAVTVGFYSSGAGWEGSRTDAGSTEYEINGGPGGQFTVEVTLSKGLPYDSNLDLDLPYVLLSLLPARKLTVSDHSDRYTSIASHWLNAALACKMSVGWVEGRTGTRAPQNLSGTNVLHGYDSAIAV